MEASDDAAALPPMSIDLPASCMAGESGSEAEEEDAHVGRPNREPIGRDMNSTEMDMDAAAARVHVYSSGSSPGPMVISQDERFAGVPAITSPLMPWSPFQQKTAKGTSPSANRWAWSSQPQAMQTAATPAAPATLLKPPLRNPLASGFPNSDGDPREFPEGPQTGSSVNFGRMHTPSALMAPTASAPIMWER
uniref:Uncharacterized protein n=1 Tax=Erythrolobus madagascarensis TaxID=708628 RepID=A0A7S0XMD7_9RHOD